MQRLVSGSAAAGDREERWRGNLWLASSRLSLKIQAKIRGEIRGDASEKDGAAMSPGSLGVPAIARLLLPRHYLRAKQRH
jgi:hypothetical protein